MRAWMRWSLALLALYLPAVAVGSTALVWWSSLPARVASHWSGLGVADGSVPTVGMLAVSGTVATAAAIVGTVLVAREGPARRAARFTLTWAGCAAGIAAAIWLVPTWATLQAGSAEEAVLGVGIVPVVLSVFYGVVPGSLAPRATVGGAAEPPSSSLQLAATEVGAWSRTVTAQVFVYATLVVVILIAVIEVPLLLSGHVGESVPSLVVLLAAGIMLASFIRLRITVDWRGLRIVSLLLQIPLTRIPLDRIGHAEAAELRAGEWGGWGYRIMPGRSALLLRAGPGLIVTRTDGRKFAVTLSDPETPAGLLSALRSDVGGGAAQG